MSDATYSNCKRDQGIQAQQNYVVVMLCLCSSSVMLWVMPERNDLICI